MKKLISVLLVVLVLSVSFAGCKSETADVTPTTTSLSPFHNPTEPSVPTEPVETLNLPIPEGFSNAAGSPAAEGYAFLYSGPIMGITGKKISKESLPETVTDIASFAAFEANRNCLEAVQKDGFWSFIDIDDEQNEPQIYLSVCYEGAENYWVVTIYSPDRVYEDNKEIMWDYITCGKF